jgi:uncharacterized glyoxalase superfamily protein PhnB
MDYALAGMGRLRLAAKDYIWEQNDNGLVISFRKKEAAPCSLNGAAAASIKLVQNYTLTQFILQTRDTPWGTYAGMFRDKYGIEWIVEFDPNNN